MNRSIPIPIVIIQNNGEFIPILYLLNHLDTLSISLTQVIYNKFQLNLKFIKTGSKGD